MDTRYAKSRMTTESPSRVYVFFHGLGASQRSFDSLGALLERKGHRVVGIDCPGFGTRKTERYTGDPFDCVVEESLSLVEKAENIVLVGHSMGGALALKTCQRLAKDKVSAIVLIEGNLIAEDCGLLSRCLAAAEEITTVNDTLGVLRASLATSPYPGYKLWVDDIRDIDPRVLRDYARSLVRESDAGELLACFLEESCKTLYLYGEEYVNHPVLTRLPEKCRSFIKGAGHFVMTDKPDETAQAILAL